MKNIIYKIISASLSAFILMSALTLDSFGYEFEYINYHWARDDIQKLADAGIFTGITQSRFEPDVYVTRGMVAVTVCRMLNVDPEDRVAFFKDVDNNRYYAPYIAWAYEKNILTGYSDMTFRAEAPVTRQEMFCIMH